METMNLHIMLLFLAAASTTVHLVKGANILMPVFPVHAYLKNALALARELGRNNHTAYIIIAENHKIPERSLQSDMKIITFKYSAALFYSVDTLAHDYFHNQEKYISDMVKPINAYIGAILADEEMFDKLHKIEFDLGILNGQYYGMQYYYLIMHRLDISYISLEDFIDPWLLGLPAFPSVVPHSLSSFTNNMDILGRICNLWVYLNNYFSDDWPSPPEKVIDIYRKRWPYTSTQDLMQKSLLWIRHREILLDYPIPTLPHVVDIGGLHTEPAKPLGEEFDKIVSAANDGVILVSFGSLLSALPKEIVSKFFNAFKQIPQTVIWSYPIDVGFDIPANVKIYKWIPQNDILGNPNVRLFINHGGNNGQYEALYHGVPMIGFPLDIDQDYNAKRVVQHGYGTKLDLKTFSSDQLVDTIKHMLTNQTYSDKIKHASRIFRSAPMTPTQQAVYWIEHLLQFGADHLRSSALTMPWYKYIMVDIVLIMALSVLFPFLLIVLCKQLVNMNV